MTVTWCCRDPLCRVGHVTTEMRVLQGGNSCHKVVAERGAFTHRFLGCKSDVMRDDDSEEGRREHNWSGIGVLYKQTKL